MSAPLRPLDPTRVEIWYARVPAEPAAPQIERCRTVLDRAEIARADRFLFPRDRALFAVAHALVRTSLSRYAERHPGQWEFATNNYGRPEIVDAQNHARLRFNLTHTRGLAACAVTCEREIGLDVEAIARRDVSESVARRFFAPAEVATLRDLPLEERQQAFLNFWTLKESYIKARGMGLAIPLSHFWFSPPAQADVQITFDPRLDDDPASWQFERLRVGNDFLLALAIRNPQHERPVEIMLEQVEDPGLLF